MLDQVLKKIFRFFASLKLAVVVLFLLTASLATATFLESAYDTPTAQYYVYKSFFFYFILLMLGVNIICSAFSRYPWKKRHAPFLLAHIGIIMMLVGSWLTQHYGLDGNLRITEGETSGTVELDNAALLIMDKNDVKKVPIPWIPPTVAFKKVRLMDRGLPYDLTIDQYVTHADPIYNFLPDTSPAGADTPTFASGKPAVQVRLKGGPMQIVQDFWLWGGDPGWSSVQAGPALLSLDLPGVERAKEQRARPGHPTLSIVPGRDGITYLATSSEGKKVSGKLSVLDFEKTPVVNPGWKNVSITFEKYFPRSIPQTTYKVSRQQYGQLAPPSAIHLVSGSGGEGAEIWLGLGEKAVLDMHGKEVEIGYFPERLVLPFALRLNHFKIDHYDGTRDPSSYSSQVNVVDDGPDGSKAPKEPIDISMNEPLHYKGTTLYQASYEDAEPRPVTSIFAVNRDPGRFLKYLGSLTIVFGAILLFASRYWSKWRLNKVTQSSHQ
jgi:hypothetical protein